MESGIEESCLAVEVENGGGCDGFYSSLQWALKVKVKDCDLEFVWCLITK